MTVLFVCTGNTCRSPLAAAVARALVGHESAAIEVESAGTAARPGAPASEHALRVARDAGLDLTPHRSQPLTPGLLRRSTLVLVMGRTHLHQVRAMAPEAPAHLLAEYAEGVVEDVPDPMGGDLEVYRRCLAHLRRLVERSLRRFQRGCERERI